MTAYNSLKTRIDRLANTAKVYGDVPFMGYISQAEDEFVLDLRFTRKGVYDRSEERRFKTANEITQFISRFESQIIIFEAEENLQ
jgi:hypothetical protein